MELQHKRVMHSKYIEKWNKPKTDAFYDKKYRDILDIPDFKTAKELFDSFPQRLVITIRLRESVENKSLDSFV